MGFRRSFNAADTHYVRPMHVITGGVPPGKTESQLP